MDVPTIAQPATDTTLPCADMVWEAGLGESPGEMTAPSVPVHPTIAAEAGNAHKRLNNRKTEPSIFLAVELDMISLLRIGPSIDMIERMETTAFPSTPNYPPPKKTAYCHF
ncbi:hypothetical protein AWM79_12470 [Pseudomonas agarici]|uniref:Uncharacterized protein n=1 Tax=Pseudomonas agarici TaxID=46677 RepID=A0A0X1T1U2_PSEAA|nr:hypothetical protein AWM79_12470 [Pseudomonas agarici]